MSFAVFSYRLRSCITAWLILCCCTGSAQCPPNIGFEQGHFEYWECATGLIDRDNGKITLNASSPVYGRHTILTNTYPQVRDFYGGFPVNCPNGSSHSIQLGNSGTGRQVDQVSYTFTIPADNNNFSMIYNYAVVFQNPGHADWEQPKFTANVFDVSSNEYITCSSFSYTASANLPGFKESPQRDSIFYKSWTPVTIKLSGYAGRTIRLEFTTNDCSRGGHFGYAYVDVNENCSSPISGNITCNNQESITMVAPFGFAGYRWFTSDFSMLLGNDITLKLKPPPAADTRFAVEVTPFPEQGCVDTVYTQIVVTNEDINLNVPAKPITACANSTVDLTSPAITSGSSNPLTYNYFTDASQINYLPTPKFVSSSGTFYIRAANASGCMVMKPVSVEILPYPDVDVIQPDPVTRPGTIDISKQVSGDFTGVTLSYWKDEKTTIPLKPTTVGSNGTFYVKAVNAAGCSVLNAVTVKIIEPVIIPPNVFSPNGDGIHDTWDIPLLSLYPDCEVEIFNRLGQRLYRSVGYGKPWDGKYNGVDLPIATYYYVIKLPTGVKPLGGGVTIVR
jgi:gliding motility-associated-like protein